MNDPLPISSPRLEGEKRVRVHADGCGWVVGPDHRCTCGLTKQPRLTLRPSTLADAKKFVAEEHRHHGPPIGHRFSVGCHDEERKLRAVMVMGRAVAPKTDQTFVLEVARVASDGCPNACSFLYGAACRVHKVHGFTFAQTFTLPSEPGTSLIAAGWKPVALTDSAKTHDGGWASRPGRSKAQPPGRKIRWECRCGPSPKVDLAELRAELGELFEATA